MSVRLQFKCWKCKNVLKELPGDAHNVREQVMCATCGALNVLDYAFPLADVEIVGEPDPPPSGLIEDGVPEEYQAKD